MSILLHYLKLLFTTIAFLSWIPIPQVATTDKNLQKMGAFFPVAGAVFGGCAALVLFFANYCFPYPVSVALALFAFGWITGAFHEDALADVADGMGGWDKNKILEIMRDSRIGVYGSFALIASYVLRYAAIASTAPETAIRDFIAYAAVSRATGVLFLTMAGKTDIPSGSLSRTIPFSGQWLSFGFALLFAALIVYVVSPAKPFLIPYWIIVVPVFARIYFIKRIGAITGDCAGFVIHVTETILYVLASMKI